MKLSFYIEVLCCCLLFLRQRRPGCLPLPSWHYNHHGARLSLPATLSKTWRKYFRKTNKASNIQTHFVWKINNCMIYFGKLQAVYRKCEHQFIIPGFPFISLCGAARYWPSKLVVKARPSEVNNDNNEQLEFLGPVKLSQRDFKIIRCSVWSRQA